MLTSPGAVTKVRHLFQKQRSTLELRWPIYDFRRYIRNREGFGLYQLHQKQMSPTPVERNVIQNLMQSGISVVPFSALLPSEMLGAVQTWAEELLKEPSAQQRIQAALSSTLPKGTKKPYLVRPLGEPPALDVHDPAVRVGLAEPILRIVSGYLAMFGRLGYLDLWYNLPTGGPDEFSQRWHRDPEDRRLVKLFLYLRDVSEKDGPFCYVPGSHFARRRNKLVYPQKMARANYPPDGFVESHFPPDCRKTCTGPAGTLVFCDTTGFHKGGHALPGSNGRYLMTAMYTTNGGAPVTARYLQPLLHGFAAVALSPAAQYAAGLLGDTGDLF